MSNLVQHAIRELEAANVEEDVRPSIIASVRAFASYGHSGGSASVVRDIIHKLLDFEALTHLTDNPDEWQNVSGYSDGHAWWQNRRQSDAFSMDGGRTYYVLAEERRWLKRILPRFISRRLSEKTYRRLLFPFHESRPVL